MRILIAGAGVAGLTVAYWLKRYGFTPTIVERAPKLLTGGYKIDVRGTALQVLKKMDIEEAINTASTQMQAAILIDKDGNHINKMSGESFGHRTGDDVEIIRGELCQILMNQIPDVEILFGDTILEITDEENRVQVRFKNNKPQTFDLLIGADGLHSTVRKLIFGDEAQFLHPLGLYLCVYTLPNYLNLDRVEMQYSEVGKIAAVWSARGEANMKACFGFAAPYSSIDLRNKEEHQQVLKRIYADVKGEFPRLIAMQPEAIDYYFDAAAQIDMSCWSKGRVVLVGDAAYCASPMSGQGTSLALIGAYVLAGEIATAKSNCKLAFDHYENEMRSFVKINQALAVTAAKLMNEQNKDSVLNWLIRQMMRIAPGRLIQFLIDLSTKRIKRAANSIQLKTYST